MKKKLLSFNRPYLTGGELSNIRRAHANLRLAAHGEFSKKCEAWLGRMAGGGEAFLTHTGTTALETAAALAGLGPGDEVILPSYGYVTTACAIALRGAVPVFVDIRPDTLNLDEYLIESAVTRRTKAIVPVHYAGVACEMDAILAIARRRKLLVIEDAAHGLLSSYRGRPLGSMGHLATFSFHETKNVISGEGGGLVVNDRRFLRAARVYNHEGTDRLDFEAGRVGAYTWKGHGSSTAPSELTAAFLWAQMEEARRITVERVALWETYYAALEKQERHGGLRRPIVPPYCTKNGHMFHVLLDDRRSRDGLIRHLRRGGVDAVFHYMPLHATAFGRRVGRAAGALAQTTRASETIVRLPLWVGLGKTRVRRVAALIAGYFAR